MIIHLCFFLIDSLRHSFIYSLFLILVLRIIQKGESNNHVGNKRYRKVVDERKVEYRKINSKQRKLKTVFVRDIVSHINKCGGRFIDVDSKGKYYVVTMEKARKKT